jgi:hypothetical protein
MASRFLNENCPSWFLIKTSSSLTLTGFARVLGTLWEASGVELCVEGFSTLTVREATPGTVFPARCPERHVQRDQTFCLGLRDLEVTSNEAAKQWWEQLRQYLCCQSVAERTGIWPPSHALDHGDAGKWHERALIASRELGIEEEYAAAYLGEPSWITDPSLRFFDKKGNPINGRAPCPRGCRHTSRRKWPVVRKDCENRALILELVSCEQKRRIDLEKYWERARAKGETCCGRMKTCGLR